MQRKRAVRSVRLKGMNPGKHEAEKQSHEKQDRHEERQ
jgi:hypothetical protein